MNIGAHACASLQALTVTNTLDVLLRSSPLQVPFSSAFREFEHTLFTCEDLSLSGHPRHSTRIGPIITDVEQTVDQPGTATLSIYKITYNIIRSCKASPQVARDPLKELTSSSSSSLRLLLWKHRFAVSSPDLYPWAWASTSHSSGMGCSTSCWAA